MSRRAPLFLLATLALLLSACGSSQAAGDKSPTTLDVVTTTPQLADFVKQVGGSDVQVRNLLRPGVDPHDFEPSPADLQAISTADVIVRNGVGLESWFDSTIKSASPRGKVIDSSAGVALRHAQEEGGEHQGEAHGEDDPHIWQSPRNAKVMVTNVTNALKAAAPAQSATFDANNARYQGQLDSLDSDIEKEISTLPDKKLVTDHDALGYFVDRYGMQYVGSVVPTFDSQADLSPAQINDLVGKIRQTGTKAIFVSQTVSAKTADTIGREANVKVVSGEDSIYADSLAQSGDAATYIGAMRHNARVIVDNLR